jgi:hypothetical protein
MKFHPTGKPIIDTITGQIRLMNGAASKTNADAFSLTVCQPAVSPQHGEKHPFQVHRVELTHPGTVATTSVTFIIFNP